MKQWSPSQANPEIVVNENFDGLSHVAVYASASTTVVSGTTYTRSGLSWPYYGGRWGGFPIADGVLTLTDASTNYLVVEVATGVLSSSASGTNWADATNYARAYKLTTASGVVSAAEDHRAGPGGVHGGGTPGSGGAQLGDVNQWTANQSVAPAALTDGGTIATDASASNNFRVMLGGNRTLANPSSLTDGMVLNFVIVQDSTGSRTLAYGSKFKWPGGTAPVLSTAPGAIDFISAYYDATGDKLLCNAALGMA